MSVLAPNSLEKAPAEVLFWAVDFRLLITAAGEAQTGTPTVVATLVFPAAGALPTIDQVAISGTQVVFRVSGGVDGCQYRLDITTATLDTAAKTRTRQGDLLVIVND